MADVELEPPMRRAGFLRLARLLIIVVLLVCALVWRVIDRDGADKKPSTAKKALVSTRPTTAAPEPATTVPAQAPDASLAAVLPLELAGYRIDTGAKATGSLDIDAAVAAESDAQAERALLETRRFERGYGRAFTNDEADVYMVVYDFAVAEDASLYLTDGFITLTGKGASIYDVAEVPGARGFSQGAEFQGRPTVVHGVAFAKADRFVLVFTRSPSASTPAEAKQLASTVYQRA